MTSNLLDQWVIYSEHRGQVKAVYTTNGYPYFLVWVDTVGFKRWDACCCDLVPAPSDPSGRL